MTFKPHALRFTFYVLLLLLVACNPAVEEPSTTPDTNESPALPSVTPADVATSTPIPPSTPIPDNGYPDADNAGNYPAPETIADPDTTDSYPAPIVEDSPEGGDRIAPISVSPDGRWEVFLHTKPVSIETEDQDGVRDTLFIQSTFSSMQYLLTDRVRPLGLNYLVPDVVAWTADSSRVYFGERNIVVNNGGLFAGFKTVSYFEFQTFFVVDLYADDAYNLALASDYSTLATVGWGQNPEVTIHQLDAGISQTTPLPIPAEYAGNIHWSSDNSYLIITTSSDTSSENPLRSFVRINAADGSTQILWENVPNDPLIFDWIGEGNLPIRDRNGDQWRLNPNTGELTIVE